RQCLLDEVINIFCRLLEEQTVEPNILIQNHFQTVAAGQIGDDFVGFVIAFAYIFETFIYTAYSSANEGGFPRLFLDANLIQFILYAVYLLCAGEGQEQDDLIIRSIHQLYAVTQFFTNPGSELMDGDF